MKYQICGTGDLNSIEKGICDTCKNNPYKGGDCSNFVDKDGNFLDDKGKIDSVVICCYGYKHSTTSAGKEKGE